MYNEERKRQFLRERSAVAEIAANTESGFISAEYYENSMGRDLCEWSAKEIITFFKYYSTAKAQSLINLKNCFQIYTDWCLNNRLVGDNQNHYSEITTEDICNCVDVNKLGSHIVTREELLEAISELENYCDRFLFLGIFEGIPPRSKVLGGLRFDQVVENTITFDDGKTLEISDELKHIIEIAEEEWGRVQIGRVRNNKVIPYEETDTIIRKEIKKDAQENVALLICKRFKSCINYMGLPSEITQKDISESGRLHYIKQMMEKYGITLEQALSSPYRREHENIYGAVQNTVIYANTYGKFI